jgi:uncharacterized cupredoxin-like copper-binding protein
MPRSGPALPLILSACLASGSAFAAGDLTKQDPTPVALTLGTPEGQHRFTPDALSFETGTLYALRLHNAGKNPYYFGSQGLADAVYSRKVVVLGPDGSILAEVYGPVRRMELKPGATVEWWFLPVRTGRFDDVMSTRSHTEAGMRAVFEVR